MGAPFQKIEARPIACGGPARRAEKRDADRTPPGAVRAGRALRDPVTAYPLRFEFVSENLQSRDNFVTRVKALSR